MNSFLDERSPLIGAAKDEAQIELTETPELSKELDINALKQVIHEAYLAQRKERAYGGRRTFDLMFDVGYAYIQKQRDYQAKPTDAAGHAKNLDFIYTVLEVCLLPGVFPENKMRLDGVLDKMRCRDWGWLVLLNPHEVRFEYLQWASDSLAKYCRETSLINNLQIAETLFDQAEMAEKPTGYQNLVKWLIRHSVVVKPTPNKPMLFQRVPPPKYQEKKRKPRGCFGCFG